MKNRRDLKKNALLTKYFIINLDDDKFRTHERCTFFIRSELRCKPHENPACVFLSFTSSKMEMGSDVKNMSKNRRRGGFYRPLRRWPLANHVPLTIEGVYDLNAVGGVGGIKSPPRRSLLFFLKSLSISIFILDPRKEHTREKNIIVCFNKCALLVNRYRIFKSLSYIKVRLATKPWVQAMGLIKPWAWFKCYQTISQLVKLAICILLF